jgi:hypothetical protein
MGQLPDNTAGAAKADAVMRSFATTGFKIGAQTKRARNIVDLSSKGGVTPSAAVANSAAPAPAPAAAPAHTSDADATLDASDLESEISQLLAASDSTGAGDGTNAAPSSSALGESLMRQARGITGGAAPLLSGGVPTASGVHQWAVTKRMTEEQARPTPFCELM